MSRKTTEGNCRTSAILVLNINPHRTHWYGKLRRIFCMRIRILATDSAYYIVGFYRDITKDTFMVRRCSSNTINFY